MVDTIRIVSQVSYRNLREEKWNVIVNQETGEFYYQVFVKNIRLAYYPDTR